MFHQLTYRVAKKAKAIRVTAEQAKRIRDIMDLGDASKFITVGLETVQVRDIQSLTAEDMNTGANATKDLRRRLRSSADGCLTCKGEGFVDVLVNQDGSLARMVGMATEWRKSMCDCQMRVKATAGLEPHDFSWMNRDEHRE